MLADVERPLGESRPAMLLAGDLTMVVYVRFIAGVDGVRGMIVKGARSLAGMETALREWTGCVGPRSGGTDDVLVGEAAGAGITLVIREIPADLALSIAGWDADPSSLVRGSHGVIVGMGVSERRGEEDMLPAVASKLASTSGFPSSWTSVSGVAMDLVGVTTFRLAGGRTSPPEPLRAATSSIIFLNLKGVSVSSDLYSR